jgi:hypothetical protein
MMLIPRAFTYIYFPYESLFLLGQDVEVTFVARLGEKGERP